MPFPLLSRKVASRLVVVALAALAGCKDNSVNIGDIVIKGTVTGEAPGELTSGVLWVIEPKGPDYGYGSGSASGGAFNVRLTGGPPDDGLNGGSVGVGLVVLATPGQDVPRGSVLDQARLSLAGVSSRTAIIYRSGDSSIGLPWVSLFPAGLSCGRCVAASDGETLDTFEPVACSAVEVTMGSSLSSADVCHWY